LIACPIPEKYEVNYEIMEKVINEALSDCRKAGITGKSITPFLLDRIKNLTDGRSLEANIELVINNAEIGAEIAVKINSCNS